MAWVLGLLPGALEVGDHRGTLLPSLFSGAQGVVSVSKQLYVRAFFRNASIVQTTNRSHPGARTGSQMTDILSAELSFFFLKGQNLTPGLVTQGPAFQVSRGHSRSILATTSSK